MNLAPFALALALASCDGQPIHELDPTWSRMMEQRRADTYGATSAFDDGMVMRAPPKGTRPVDAVDEDAPPPKITRESIERGRERFETLCAACHGVTGDGDSVVATKMKRRPPSFTEPHLLDLDAREIHDVARDGYGLMPSYATKLDAEERWDVAYYVLALRRSRHVVARDLPADERAELERAP
jgi:mono/diheme cytochrome c family protein